MQELGFLGTAVMLKKILSRFVIEHFATRRMIKCVFINEGWNKRGRPEIRRTLKFRQEGSMFRVIETYLLMEHKHETSWLASYHSNGSFSLWELGGDRCCMFDPLGKKVFLSEETVKGTQVTRFIQFK